MRDVQIFVAPGLVSVLCAVVGRATDILVGAVSDRGASQQLQLLFVMIHCTDLSEFNVMIHS